jgi:hypothetical protein
MQLSAVHYPGSPELRHFRTWNIVIVAYKPVAWKIFQANIGTAAVVVQRRGKHASSTTNLLLGKQVPATTLRMQRETKLCLRRPRRGVIKKRTRAISQLSSARKAEK